MSDNNKTRIIRKSTRLEKSDIDNYENDNSQNARTFPSDAVSNLTDVTMQMGSYSDNTSYDEGTRILKPNPSLEPLAKSTFIPQEGSGNKTRLFRKGISKDLSDKMESEDPVVGWLVITNGCGKGKSFELGEGNNTVGRDKSQKVSIDFGDLSISRENHFKIIYEPKHKKFYILPGESRNLTYLNDNIFGGLTEIKNFDKISIGETELTFIGFCGENFSWL